MSLIALLLCATIFVLCTLGVFHTAFKDNLLQCVGLSVMALGALSYGWAVWQSWPVNPKELILLIGIFSYSLGNLQKVVHHMDSPRTSFPALDV